MTDTSDMIAVGEAKHLVGAMVLSRALAAGSIKTVKRGDTRYVNQDDVMKLRLSKQLGKREEGSGLMVGNR
jgi:hypothetical protein